MGTEDRRTTRAAGPSEERRRARARSDGSSAPGLPRPRSVEKRDRRSREVRDAPRKLARSFVELPKRINPLVTVAVVLVVAFVALSVATPLRNYFQQRAELAEVNATIERQIDERDRLNEELDRYDSEAYIREQARTRLGVVEPGESAFRLMDPRINTSSPADPGQEESADDPDPWYTQLWGSVSEPDEDGDGPSGEGSGDGDGDDGDGDGDDGDGDGGSNNLPIDPNQDSPAQEGDQDVQEQQQEQQQQQQQGAQ
ncbi:MAG: septum formation initiator family protein [Corynebacterium sp.]|uniref:septum formation initiator family protein n=1 Tax=Corynebacterium sp. TaxID=1720 RepID=UPI003F99B17B